MLSKKTAHREKRKKGKAILPRSFQNKKEKEKEREAERKREDEEEEETSSSSFGRRENISVNRHQTNGVTTE